jgi:hypothetical protein
MVKHIVMWKLKGDGALKRENIQNAKAALDTCRDLVPGMLKYEVGVDIGVDSGPWDLALYSEFSDRTALDAYQRHPRHVAVRSANAPLCEARSAVDFEV